MGAALPPAGLGAFHDHAALTAALQQLAAAHPSLVTLRSLGRSVEGRDLSSLTLRAHADDARPLVLFDGAHHGDEVIASEILYRYAAGLAQEYPSTARSRDLLDRVNVVIVPHGEPGRRQAPGEHTLRAELRYQVAGGNAYAETGASGQRVATVG